MKHEKPEDSPLTSPHDPFERALRAGPRRIEPSLDLASRVESAWRRAGVEEVPEADRLWDGWPTIWRDLRGPVLAMAAAIALVVGLIRFEPPAVREGGPAVAETPSASPVPLPVRAPQRSAPDALSNSFAKAPALLASLGDDVDDSFETEARLIVDDTRRALRFATGQLLTPRLRAFVESQGIDLEAGARQG